MNIAELEYLLKPYEYKNRTNTWISHDTPKIQIAITGVNIS